MSIEFNFAKRLHGAEGELQLQVAARFEPGELVVLYGPSGAGKTTLLRLIAGLSMPDSGWLRVQHEIWWDSQRRINLPTRRRDIAVVFQDYALFPNMTVYENLLYGLRDPTQRNDIEQLLELTQLGELRTRLPQTLSGGQRQRVALARALLRQAKIMLLDEPFAALDPLLRQQLQDEIIARQRRTGALTLLVSHDLAEVYKLATQVLMLDQGQVVRAGRPQAVFGETSGLGKFEFLGEILAISREDVLYAVSVLVGNQLVSVLATQDEIADLAPGNKVKLLAKAFNPMLLKIS